jgi:diguanylate cyclase (GGDEF)-like protein/PAS domain S-box-containing protein
MKNAIFKKLIDLSNVGYAYLELINPTDAIFLEVNKEFSTQTGKSSEELIGLSVSDVYRDKSKWMQVFSLFFLTHKDQDYEYFMDADNRIYRLKIINADDNHFVVMMNENIQAERLFFNNLRYQSIINNMNDVIWIMDFDYHFTYFSPSVDKLVGYTAEEMMSMPLREIMLPKSFEQAKKTIGDAITQEKSGIPDPSRMILFETEHRRKDGKVVVIENVIQFLRDGNQEAYSIMGLGRDITEWKEAKENLKKSRNQLQLILDSAGEGIFGVDIEGHCTFCNASCLGLLGYEQDELLGTNIHRILYPSDEEERVIGETRTLKLFEGERGTFVDDEIFWRKDGSYFHAEYYSYPQYQDGNVIGAVVTFYDITNRKTVESELKESERSKTVFLSNLPGMAYRCNYDPQWTMEFVSEGCYRLTGYKPEDLLYNNKISYNDIIKPEYRLYLWNTWTELVINKKLYFREEYMITTASGEEKWVLEQGQVLYDEDGGVEALEGLIIDITEQKKRQEEVEYLSYHDGLTGLYNRIYFDEMRQRFDQDAYLPLSLIVGDINGLKFMNDTLGHHEGDRMIIKTAELIQSCLTDDQILSRTSGDEFSILLPNTSAEAAYEVLKKILQAFTDYDAGIIKDLFKIKIALGFATKENMETSFTTLQKIAEDYMYKRKLLERSSSHSAIIESIKTTMYEKNQETEAHAERMQILSRRIGERINLSQIELDELALLATLHDIGKVGIDNEILTKPGKLSEEEWVAMKRHPEIGYRIAMASSELMSIANYILCHHEKWDGSGYPQGLKGTTIPLLSRIIAIVDAYDAMTQDRPYRKALPKETALSEIKDKAGTQFDPLAADIFVTMMNECEDF